MSESSSTSHGADPSRLREHAGELHGLREQAVGLRLHGLLAHWAQAMGQPEQARWVAQMLGWEAAERSRRSLARCSHSPPRTTSTP